MRDLIKKLKLNRFLNPDWLIYRLIFIALLIRIITILQMVATPIGHGLVQDTQEFDFLAKEMIKGNFTQTQLLYVNPFYPYILTVIYRLFGQNSFSVFIIQAILDAMNCYLLYLIGSVLYDKKIGIISAMIYTFYGIAIFYSGTLLATTMVLFFILLAFFLYFLAQNKEKGGFYLLSGVTFGLVFSARQNIGLFIVFLLIWMIVNGDNGTLKKRLFRMTLTGSGIFLIISLMIFRNYALEKKISPFSSHGGINFYIGNNQDATGQFMSPDGVSHSPLKQISTSILQTQKELGKSLTPSQASQFWYQKGFDYLKKHPQKAFRLILKKFLLFWRKEEIPLNANYQFCRTLIPILRFPWISFGLIGPLGLFGIFISYKNRRAWIIIGYILLYMISIILFFVSARYRFPIVPFLIIFCSYGLTRIIQWFKGKEVRKLYIAMPLLGLLYLAVNVQIKTFASTIDSAVDHNNLGSVYLRQGQFEKAEKEFNTVLLLHPAHVQGHYNLGLVYHYKELYNQAINEYNRTIDLDPQFYPAYNNLGAIYFQLGQNKEAEKAYQKALNLIPDSEKSYFGLGKLYYHQEEFQRAKLAFKKTIEIQSDFVEAYYYLGLIYLEEHNEKTAIQIWQRGLEIDPRHEKMVDQLNTLQPNHSEDHDSY